MLKPSPSDAPHNGQCMNMTCIYIYMHIYICSCYIHVFEHMAFIMCIYILVFPYIHLIYCHMYIYIYIEAAMAQNSIGFRLIQRKIVKLKILPKDQGEKQTNLHCTLRFA